MPFVGLAIHMAFNHVPDFYDRVVGYRLRYDRIAEVAEEVLEEPYYTIEFFELDVPLPPPRRVDTGPQSLRRVRSDQSHEAVDFTFTTSSGTSKTIGAIPEEGLGGYRRLGTATGADLADAFRQGTLGIPEFAERVAGYRFDGNKLRSFTAEEPLIRYVSVTFYELVPE